jgi:hypothetical protein
LQSIVSWTKLIIEKCRSWYLITEQAYYWPTVSNLVSAVGVVWKGLRKYETERRTLAFLEWNSVDQGLD